MPVIYDLVSQQSITQYVKFTGNLPVELPVGGVNLLFSPGSFYLLSDLNTTEAAKVSVAEYLTKGLLVLTEFDPAELIAASAAPVDSAALVISYTTPKSFLMSSGATGVAPTGTTGSAVSYSIDKNLPNGLSLNTTTGVISGSPTGATGTAAANYRVTALNADGEAYSTIISIAVVGNNTPIVSYVTPVSFLMSSGATGVAPTGLTGLAVSYTIDKNLPNGLALNATTGFIAGTPTGITGTVAADYVVTAKSSGGFTSDATINIAVVGNNQPLVSYAESPVVFLASSGATGIAPTGLTGLASAYSIDKNLPNALSINPTTGVISGTPTGATAAADDYTVTAVNSAGYYATTVVNITVNQ